LADGHLANRHLRDTMHFWPCHLAGRHLADTVFAVWLTWLWPCHLVNRHFGGTMFGWHCHGCRRHYSLLVDKSTLILSWPNAFRPNAFQLKDKEQNSLSKLELSVVKLFYCQFSIQAMLMYLWWFADQSVIIKNILLIGISSTHSKIPPTHHEILYYICSL
jgi:hypothetical protein